MSGEPLVAQRGAMNCEYAGELADFIERTNCRKGCVHATPEQGGEWINCSLGLLAQLFVGGEIPEFEAHGNRYVVCTKRVEPQRQPEEVSPDQFSLFEEVKP